MDKAQNRCRCGHRTTFPRIHEKIEFDLDTLPESVHCYSCVQSGLAANTLPKLVDVVFLDGQGSLIRILGSAYVLPVQKQCCSRAGFHTDVQYLLGIQHSSLGERRLPGSS